MPGPAPHVPLPRPPSHLLGAAAAGAPPAPASSGQQAAQRAAAQQQAAQQPVAPSAPPPAQAHLLPRYTRAQQEQSALHEATRQAALQLAAQQAAQQQLVEQQVVQRQAALLLLAQQRAALQQPAAQQATQQPATQQQPAAQQAVQRQPAAQQAAQQPAAEQPAAEQQPAAQQVVQQSATQQQPVAQQAAQQQPPAGQRGGARPGSGRPRKAPAAPAAAPEARAVAPSRSSSRVQQAAAASAAAAAAAAAQAQAAASAHAIALAQQAASAAQAAAASAAQAAAQKAADDKAIADAALEAAALAAALNDEAEVDAAIAALFADPPRFGKAPILGELYLCPAPQCSYTHKTGAYILRHARTAHAEEFKSGAFDEAMRELRLGWCDGGCDYVGLITKDGTFSAVHTKACKRSPAGSRVVFDTTTSMRRGVISALGLITLDPGVAAAEESALKASARAKAIARLIITAATAMTADASDANQALTTAATELASLAPTPRAWERPPAHADAATARRERLGAAAAAANEGHLKVAAALLQPGGGLYDLAAPGAREAIQALYRGTALSRGGEPAIEAAAGLTARIHHGDAPAAGAGAAAAADGDVPIKAFEAEDVRAYLRHARLGKGEAGVRTADLAEALDVGGDEYAAALATLVTHKNANLISNVALNRLFHTERMMAITKGDGSPRPITMLSGVAKLGDHLADKHFGPYLRDQAAANFALGTSGGSEAQAALAQAAHNAGRDVLSVDIKGAYPNVHLGALCDAYKANRQLLLYIASAYGRQREAIYGRGSSDELRVDVVDGIAQGAIPSTALFSGAMEPVMAALRTEADVATNFSDDAIAAFHGVAAKVVRGTRAATAEGAARGLHWNLTKCYLLAPTPLRAEELHAAYDEEAEVAPEDPPIKPRIVQDGIIVAGLPVGSLAFIKAAAVRVFDEALAMAHEVLCCTETQEVRGVTMTRHAALRLLDACVAPKVTYLVRYLGAKVQTEIEAHDAAMTRVYRRLLGLPESDAADSHDQRVLWGKVTEPRASRGFGLVPAASFMNAGHVACNASSAAALLRHCGHAVRAASDHSPTHIGILPPGHDAAIAHLVAAGVSAGSLESSGVTETAIAAAGAAGSGKGKQRCLTVRLSEVRDQARKDDPALVPATRISLALGHGHGYAALNASRRCKAARLDDLTVLDIAAEVLGREAIAAPRVCLHCTRIMDTMGAHATSCDGTAGFRKQAHDHPQDAWARVLAGSSRSSLSSAVREPHLQDHPAVFGPPKAGARDARADLVVTDAEGVQTFIDGTVLWAPLLHPMPELLNPGLADKKARARKVTDYEAAHVGAGSKVRTVCISAHGDVTGGDRALLVRLVRQRATEKASASARMDVIKTYTNMITSLRAGASAGFWRARSRMRRASLVPRSSWVALDLVKASELEALVAVVAPEEGEVVAAVGVEGGEVEVEGGGFALEPGA